MSTFRQEMRSSVNLFRRCAVTTAPTLIVLGPEGHELRRASGGEMAALLSSEATKALEFSLPGTNRDHQQRYGGICALAYSNTMRGK